MRHTMGRVVAVPTLTASPVERVRREQLSRRTKVDLYGR